MPDIPKKRSLQFLIHFIVWGIVILFPLIFIYSEGERNIIRFLDFTLPVIFLMIVFYSNYFYIISQYLFRKKIWQFFLVNLLLFVVCLILLEEIKNLYFDSYFAKLDIQKHFPPRSRMKDILRFRDVLSMSMTVGLAVAIRMTMQWYQLQAEQKELEKLHIESELNNLKHQLNPHFLFNTLNNIYSLISINQDSAQNAVHQLSSLIRYVLYESDQSKVFLSKDLKFTANYIQLMSLRLPPQVTLESNIPVPGEEQTIAPLLFISLVENAFKHGISPEQPSRISINIEIRDRGVLICRVENSNFPKRAEDKSGSGIGLSNLRKRLELLYPETHELKIEETTHSYISTLTLML